MTTLQGMRITAEPMSLDHAGALWAILGDPDNRPGRSKSRIPHSQEDMKEFIRESLRKRIPFVLVDHRSGELVGTISLRNLKPHNQSAEICYILISKKHWGQKYAAEATWLLLRYCFEDLQCHRVQVEVAEDSAAQRLVEWLSFQFEGIKREARKVDDRYINIMVFSYLEQEWRQRQAQLRAKLALVL